MRRLFSLPAVVLVLALGFGMITPVSALAGDLDRAKAQGYLGERPDGYLGMVKPAPSSVSRLMEDVNRKRRLRYDDIARKRGTKRQAVEAIAGSKLTGKSPPGSYIMDSSGSWVRK